MARDGRTAESGKGARDRRLQFRRLTAQKDRGAQTRAITPAPFLANPTRRRRRRNPLVQRQSHRSHRLQSDADRNPDRLILDRAGEEDGRQRLAEEGGQFPDAAHREEHHAARCSSRSEEHTSELQSLAYLVCRLLLEKKNKARKRHTILLD